MWKKCAVHALLASLGCLLFFVAAIGSGIYLYLGRLELPDKSSHFNQLVNKIRYRLNLAYTSVGFTLFTIGLGLGFLQAKAIWQSYFRPDAKVIFSILIWLYYLVFLIVVARLSLKKAANKGYIFSLLSFIGALLILINFVLINFFIPSLHHYL